MFSLFSFTLAHLKRFTCSPDSIKKRFFTSFILGVACAFLIPISAEAEKSRTNILILYADDLGFGDLTSYNADSKIPTPHLDQLAAEGIRFTDGHSSSGICTPSRYALLT
ncbi:MAG: hypothetical protein CMH58_02950, partial [Myxococcales bacterium]|nr:hypothetical protein [Myxococcales bacterium]